jgi:hypothetical protein
MIYNLSPVAFWGGGVTTPFCLWVENVHNNSLRAETAGKNSSQMFNGYVLHLKYHQMSNILTHILLLRYFSK